MKRPVLIAAALVLLASTISASAVEHVGVITKIEWSIGTITLDSGDTYVVPPGIQSSTRFSVGEKVRVTEDNKIVSAITKAG